MSRRQHDLFLLQWSRRRQFGRRGTVLRGLALGAIAGLLFAFAPGLMMGTDGNRSTAPVLAALQRRVVLLGLSVPAFAGLMAGISERVFTSHDAMYHAMLDRGARVLDEPLALRRGDRGPQVDVAVTVVI